MNKKWLLSMSLLILITVLGACNDDSNNSNNNEQQDTNNNSEENTEQEAAPQPDLEGVPDVVAEVNGEEISKEDFVSIYTGQFQQALMQAQMTGQDVDQDELKGQVADALIGQQLVIQEAENSGFEASDEAIDETLNRLAQQNGLESKEAFLTALEEQGVSEEEVYSQIEMQVKVDELIASKSGDLEPTEEELQESYDAYAEQLKQYGGEDVEVPSFEDMKANLTEQVKSQKMNETYQVIVEELKESAEITNHL
ncbi:SurA N-terminal domain-containing protein [Ornithinibacillus halophilus]|uniref:peptidylprolyl isomerase n=1 Tax=Ornithinibacillus halophilus TaxID=930117 RepID=A0A1M5MUL9_9BACI|nr:SurA N-terminal domain-containing protein [Ornithinibacillus halophilus]SHG80842.1 peptidyl-prolyl cis-trans isomerase SurA [Ornithinibacillus halophilus]